MLIVHMTRIKHIDNSIVRDHKRFIFSSAHILPAGTHGTAELQAKGVRHIWDLISILNGLCDGLMSLWWCEYSYESVGGNRREGFYLLYHKDGRLPLVPSAGIPNPPQR